MGSGRAKNEKNCGVTSLKLVGRDKTQDFCEPGQWGQKRPKEAHRCRDQARSNFRPWVKSWNYFSARRNKYSIKTFSSFPPFS